jgi:cytochrome c oxidase subunit 2
MKWKHQLILMAAVMAVVLMLSACSKSNNNNAVNTAPPAAGGKTKEITVSASNFAFDPPVIKLNVGDTVKLTLKNINGSHGFEIPDLNINLKNGETATFTVDKAGSIDYNCSVQCGSGHDNMTGTITVT